MRISAWRKVVPAAVLAWGCLTNLNAADAGLCIVLKSLNYEQTNAASATPIPGTQFAQFMTFVSMTAANSVTSGKVRNPANVTNTFVADGQELRYEARFGSQAAMDAVFGSGNYLVSMVTAHDGNRAFTLNLQGDLYPPVPLVSNYDAAQAMNPADPFTFNWSFVGGTANDTVLFQIRNWDTGDTVFATPFPGQAGAYTGLSNSVVVPGGLLTSGRTYEVELDFIRPSAVDATTYPGALAAAVYSRATTLDLTPSSGAVDTNSPWLQNTYPWHNERLAINGNIAFSFSEPMQTNIAIAWSNAPYSFSYAWSTDRTTLFVINPGNYQANATINFTLNQSGTGFRDLAGNMLPTMTGEIFIGSQSVSPDVSEYIVMKGRLYEQTNATTVVPSTQESPYNFFAEIGQESFVLVTNATLSRPGGATEGLRFDGDYLNVEGHFNDEASLNTAYPAGTYTLTVNTVHDGTRVLPLTLPANNFPNAPRVINFAAAQSINPTQAFTLTWDAFIGGTTNDLVFVGIRELLGPDYDREVVYSPEHDEPGALNGTSNSFVIPANTLPPGRKFEILVTFVKIVQVDTNTYPGARGLGGFLSETIVYGYTTGETIKPKFQSASYNPFGRFFQFEVTGETDVQYTIEYSDDLKNWYPLQTRSAFEGRFQDADFNLPSERRFYRVREGWQSSQP